MRTDRNGEYYGRYTEDEQAPSPFTKFIQEKWDSCPMHYIWFSRLEWGSRKKKPNFNRHGAKYA